MPIPASATAARSVFCGVLERCQTPGAGVVVRGRRGGRSHPRVTTRWRSYDGYRSARLPATCCKPSAITSAPTPMSGWTSPAGKFFHTNWTGKGGKRGGGPVCRVGRGRPRRTF